MAKEPGRKFAVADTPAGILIVGAPSRINYQLYRGMLMSEDMAQKAQAPDTLLMACAVDPDSAAMKVLLDSYPGLGDLPGRRHHERRALKKIKAARSRFKRDSIYAAECWAALFRGDDSEESIVAGEQFHKAVVYSIAWVEAHRKGK
jgi:hypothetical protein